MFNTPNRRPFGKTIQGCIAATMFAATSSVLAANVTIIQVSDLHGNMVPHACVIET